MTPPRVLSVGQCGYDRGQIGRFLRDTLHAEAVAAETAVEALDALRSSRFDAVLVNRELDADGSRGVDLIRAIKADPALATVPTLLVSNFPEAQAEAIALGALPGFGKDDLRSSKARAAIEAALKPVEAR